jgi:hypothetical protein
MNELSNNNLYAAILGSVKTLYKYEIKAFAEFIKTKGNGVTLEALQEYQKHCISQSFKARTINQGHGRENVFQAAS